MDNLHSFFVVLSVLAAVIVPQALVSWYAAPRASKIEQYELDCR